MEFKEFPKIPRLSRDMVVTEKIDGTNASVLIEQIDLEKAKVLLDRPDAMEIEKITAVVGDLFISAGSRTRWITPASDNFGFAQWVSKNAIALSALGPGHHFGEWWGQGIQRGYGLKEKRFSLFNTKRWGSDLNRILTDMPKLAEGQETVCHEVPICHVVPVMYEGPFNTEAVDRVLANLKEYGSMATQEEFMQPEGVVVYHTSGNLMFKKTLEKDDKHKGEK